MFHQMFHHAFRIDGSRRPGHGQPAMQRNSRQNGHFRAAVDHQAFDSVEAVQFGLSLGHIGKIPTFRRRRPSHAAASIQDAMPSKNTADRRNCGTRLNLSGLHFAVNGGRSVFAQHALLLQPFSQPKHFLFDFLRGALRVARSPRPIRPIDPIEAFSLRPSNPVLNGTQRNPEATSHGTLRDFFASSGGNQTATLIGSQLFDSWITPHVFPLGIAVGRSTCKYPQPATPQERGGRNSSRAAPSFRSAPLSSFLLFPY